MVFIGKVVIIFAIACVIGFSLTSSEASLTKEGAAKGNLISEAERFPMGMPGKELVPLEKGEKQNKNGSRIPILTQIINDPRQLFPPTPLALKPPPYSPVAPPPPPPATDRGALPDQEKGVINPRTGEFLPGTKGGVTNPRTGDFFPKVEGGYLNPKTGEVIPRRQDNP
jgi:hypothetical protein